MDTKINIITTLDVALLAPSALVVPQIDRIPASVAGENSVCIAAAPMGGTGTDAQFSARSGPLWSPPV